DAGRIMEAVHDAGLTQIDNLIITHWHGDHFGGLAELAKQIPIKHYNDHGPNVQPGQAADDFLKNVYADLISKSQHTVLKAGDKIPFAGANVNVVISAGMPIATPRKGGEPFTMQSLFSSPGLEDVWEMHFSLLSGQEYTVPGAFIANQIDQPDTAMPIGAWTPPPQGQQAPPAPVHNGKAYFIKVTA